MSKKFLITSALPYANGPLHFGHIAGAYLPGDCFARFQRLCVNDVVYICGSDEYGVAITMSAEQAGRSYQEHVDFFHKKNQELFAKLNFSFDHYSRTTSNLHPQTVQDFFKSLYENGYIEEKTEEHLFSEKENKFLADRYVMGTCPRCGFEEARGDECQKCGASYEATDLKDPRSKITNAPLVLKPSKHWYLRFDKFKDRLKNWLETKNFKSNVTAFTEHYIKELRERAITRDSSWGIKVPLKGTDGKVFYVWFDAPIGYITATKEWALKVGDPDKWKNYWMNEEVNLIHFVGKDNIPFHTVFFPAMLMGQDDPYILPTEVPANEFLMLEGRPFSKSDNWTIDLDDFFKKYTTDQIRYYLAAIAPETSDSDFSWKDFQNKCNNDLVGKLGNFIHRTLTFARNKCGGMVPSMDVTQQEDLEFIHKVEKITGDAFHAFNSFKLRRAAQYLIELASAGNVYFDSRKPWSLAKDLKQKKEMETVIACCIQCIKNLAILAFPIMPDTAQKIWNMLGYTNLITEESWELATKRLVPSEQILPEPKVLFAKIEDEQIEQEIIKLSPKSEKISAFPDLKKLIEFDQFQQLDLRVAQVLTAKPIPKSSRLLHLEVDLGFEKRFIVAGVAKSYRPEDLVGKKIVVVANLKPAKIMGHVSEGMRLAASFEDLLEVPQLQKLKPGSVVS